MKEKKIRRIILATLAVIGLGTFPLVISDTSADIRTSFDTPVEHVVVIAGETRVLHVATRIAPAGASSAQISALATAIAVANGITNSTTLKVGRILTIDPNIYPIVTTTTTSTTTTLPPTTTTTTTLPPTTTTTTPPTTTTTSTTTTTTTTVPATTTTTTAPPANGYIPSNFDINQFIRPGTVIPESSAWEPTGNFRITCSFSHFNWDDPIVYPGQPGASHLHMYFGNTLANANSTYASLRNSGAGTCDGNAINRTAYWAPALYNAQNKAVIPDFISIYYKGPGSNANGALVNMTQMPAGLKMIAGYDMAFNQGDGSFEWYCEFNQVKQNTIPHCGSNERVGVHIVFPTCWNGTSLDSANHRSHLAYQVRNPDTGKMYCPTGYPVQLPRLEIGIWWSQDGNSQNWYLSSDRMNGMIHANGSTFHSDWFGAWDPNIQALWVDKCINGLLNCKGGELGNGSMLVGAQGYSGPKVVDPPAKPN